MYSGDCPSFTTGSEILTDPTDKTAKRIKLMWRGSIVKNNNKRFDEPTTITLKGCIKQNSSNDFTFYSH